MSEAEKSRDHTCSSSLEWRPNWIEGSWLELNRHEEAGEINHALTGIVTGSLEAKIDQPLHFSRRHGGHFSTDSKSPAYRMLSLRLEPTP